MPKNFWDEDKGFDMLITAAQGAGAKVEVGFRGDKIHKPKPKKSKGKRKSKTTSSEKVMTVAQIAMINEFGSSNNKNPPARPFMANTMENNKRQINKLINKMADKILDGKITPKNAMLQIGQFVRDAMVQTINKGVKPNNAPSTIAAKGSSTPLIDTGQLKNSIDVVYTKGKS